MPQLARSSVPLAPRPARGSVSGFTIPFQGLYHSTLHFWQRLQAARVSHDDPIETWHWDTYALAAQVFAALTAEAQLNTYGLVRFGEELFEREFRWKGPITRLQRMVARGAGVELPRSDALVRTLASLMDKRDPIVHMQSNEEKFDHSGHIIKAAPPPPHHLGRAQAAVEEMRAFLGGFAALVSQHDPESLAYIMMV